MADTEAPPRAAGPDRRQFLLWGVAVGFLSAVRLREADRQRRAKAEATGERNDLRARVHWLEVRPAGSP